MSESSAARSWTIATAVGEVRELPPASLEPGAEISGIVEFEGMGQPGIEV
jgi:hypothetical protein